MPVPAAAVPLLRLFRRCALGFFGAEVLGEELRQRPLVLRLDLRLRLRHIFEHRGGSLPVLGSAAGYGCNLDRTEGFKLAVAAAVKLYLDELAQQIHLCHVAVAVRRFDECALLGNAFHKLLIRLLLIAQTAHESAAGAGNFAGV